MIGNFSGEKELQRLLAAKFNKAQKNKVNIGYRITNPFSCSTSPSLLL